MDLKGLNTSSQITELEAKIKMVCKRALELERSLEVANADLKKAKDEIEVAKDEVEEAKLELLQPWSWWGLGQRLVLWLSRSPSSLMSSGLFWVNTGLARITTGYD